MRAVQELAAVKTSLTYIMVSLQSANEKITSISEALTSGLLSSEEKNRNNSISKREDNNSNSRNSNKTYFRVSSSGSDKSSSDESSGDEEGDFADNSSNPGRKR